MVRAVEVALIQITILPRPHLDQLNTAFHLLVTLKMIYHSVFGVLVFNL